MEIIRKKICLEKSRSRVSGLLPFIRYNDQNDDSPFIYNNIQNRDGEYKDSSWGNFPADLDDGKEFDGITRTMELLRRYNIIMDIIRSGIFVKRIDKSVDCNEGEKTDYRYREATEWKSFTKRYFELPTEKEKEKDQAKELIESSEKKEEGNEEEPTTQESLINKCDFISIDSVTEREDRTYEVNGEGKKYAVIITDYETYEKFGGIGFVNKVRKYINGEKKLCEIKKKETTPYINVPILLKQECHDMGVMTDYLEDTGYLEDTTDFSYEARGGVAFDIKEKGLHKTPELKSERKSLEDEKYLGETVEVNSPLTSLRSPDYAMADEETLPGIWQTYNDDGGQMFKCTYCITTSTIHAKKNTDEEGNVSWDWEKFGNSIPPNTLSIHKDSNVKDDAYDEDGNVTAKTQTCKYWEYEKAKIKLDCADGETVAPGEEKYQTLTIFGTIESRLSDKTPSNGDYYYFLVRYQNDLVIPYEVNVPRNISVIDEEAVLCTGDWIEKIERGDTITFDYIVQGKFVTDKDYKTFNPIEDTGVRYQESYGYYPSAVTSVKIDGEPDVLIWYQKIDFDSSKKTIYSSDYNLYRSGNTSNVMEMTTGDIWQSGVTYDDTGETINAPVFKDEFLMGSAFATKSSVDVEISRGNAAAFERHLILTECNTFEDVENYRNNYFNIE